LVCPPCRCATICRRWATRCSRCTTLRRSRKKVSARHSGAQAKISSIALTNGYRYLYANSDLTGGSSGSALFDTAGRIIGIAGHCVNGFLSITEVLADLAATPAASVKRDVMLVLDRSGSMSMGAGTGRTKIQEARDAASLFVRLIRSGVGDRIDERGLLRGVDRSKRLIQGCCGAEGRQPGDALPDLLTTKAHTHFMRDCDLRRYLRGNT
jgi:hypothetical protein